MSQCFSFEVETDIDMKTLGLSGCTAGTEDLEFLGLETLELNASSSVWTTGGKWRHFYFCLLSLSSNQIKIISLLYLEKRLSLEACCVALAPYKFLSTTEIQKLFIERLLGTRQRPAFMNRQWARTQQQLQTDAVKKINPSERMWRGGLQVKPLWEEYIWVHPQRWEELVRACSSQVMALKGKGLKVRTSLEGLMTRGQNDCSIGDKVKWVKRRLCLERSQISNTLKGHPFGRIGCLWAIWELE